MNRLIHCLFFTCTIVSAPFGQAATVIQTVPIGNPGNPADSTGFGAVAHQFRIGTFEVTNGQYAEFLNATAASDPLSLYNTSMDSSTHGGIIRSGASGSFNYSTKPGMENKPVNFVNWYDAIRFTNWLHNGQGGPAATEDGAYTLSGGTPVPSNGSSITRNADARWWLPSDQEWYKAAYHKNDGLTGNYWNFSTASDSAPTAEPPAGGLNSANYDFAVGTVTDVGAYVLSASPYGTFDQGGNVWEWNEKLFSSVVRGHRGGSWQNTSSFLAATCDCGDAATVENEFIGFRAATVPEPSAAVVSGLALLSFGLVRRRRCEEAA
jgi:formylglycine-generating enzyme required for sulfatase activity